MYKNERLSVIIPTFNRNDLLVNCLSSLLTKIDSLIEIIIVNDSEQNTIDLPIHLFSKQVKIYSNPKQGVASARNYGASKANGDLLIFIDDDMLVNSEAISSCVDFICKNEKSVYNANWEYSSESNEILNKTSFGRFLISIHFNSLKGWNNNPKDWSINRYYKCDGITSQFLGIKKIDFEEVGGYNENFPFAGFEDYEFWIRLKKQGINAFIDTQVLITHNELDKLSPKQWFARKFRGGITQKVAVDLGFKELKRNESRLKSIVFNILYIIQPTILFLINRKTKILDRFSFKVFKALTGANLSKGYSKK
jgi:glycosyltransferase involved in cell wall biosynthesis